jgi:ParB family chromosome partitioning protein
MAKSNMNLKAFAGVVQSATQRGDTNVPIDLININPQLRTQFDPVKQASINASIKAQGINQSVILLALPDGRYDLIAGEYRIRGALDNKLTEVPARVRHNLSPWEIRRIQVSENMERTDITAFDEAMGVAEDVEKYGFEVAQQSGIDRKAGSANAPRS